ncbi:MAG: hypothetical protein H6738_18765 [Alphaproteobacteria bacterium]|nr:hypothetical protein [Alphaproteobacteria bacterium]MCB9698830.1 hypothetical protein [Alphaproteobacteria bacterium]
MLVWTVVLSLAGCTTAEPPPPTPRLGRPPAGARVKAAKAKAKGKVAPTGPPVGVAGPVEGELLLTAEGPPAGGAPTPTSPVTQASLSLSFSNGTTQQVPLGRVAGTCTELEPRPVGPVGSQVESLWSVSCVDATGPHEVHLVQKDAQLLVGKTVATGHGPTIKLFKRIRLAPGAIVKRKSPWDPSAVPASTPPPSPAPAPEPVPEPAAPAATEPAEPAP